MRRLAKTAPRPSPTQMFVTASELDSAIFKLLRLQGSRMIATGGNNRFRHLITIGDL